MPARGGPTGEALVRRGVHRPAVTQVPDPELRNEQDMIVRVRKSAATATRTPPAASPAATPSTCFDGAGRGAVTADPVGQVTSVHETLHSLQDRL